MPIDTMGVLQKLAEIKIKTDVWRVEVSIEHIPNCFVPVFNKKIAPKIQIKRHLG